MSNPNKPNQRQTIKRPPCVLFSVRDANETDVAVIKKLGEAGCEIVVVQDDHFEKALKCIERVRSIPLNQRRAKTKSHD